MQLHHMQTAQQAHILAQVIGLNNHGKALSASRTSPAPPVEVVENGEASSSDGRRNPVCARLHRILEGVKPGIRPRLDQALLQDHQETPEGDCGELVGRCPLGVPAAGRPAGGVGSGGRPPARGGGWNSPLLLFKFELLGNELFFVCSSYWCAVISGRCFIIFLVVVWIQQSLPLRAALLLLPPALKEVVHEITRSQESVHVLRMSFKVR